MSKATLTPAWPAVTKTVVVTPEVPAKVALELTMEEARSLRLVIHRIGGPETGRRGHFTAMGNSLDAAGVSVDDLRDPLSGSTRHSFYAGQDYLFFVK